MTLRMLPLALASCVLLPLLACQTPPDGPESDSSAFELPSKLQDCGLLTEGTFLGNGAGLDAGDECYFDCLSAASCDELDALMCDEDGAAAEQLATSCLAQCSSGPTIGESFECGSGETVPGEWQCDSEPDCEDGSDELGCPEDFICADGTEIPPAWVCDFENDCGDGSDEQNCPGGFACADGQQIPGFWQCDGDVDCEDGSDELDCAALVCG